MIIKSGKKAGKSTQELVLKEPDWVQAFLQNVQDGTVPAALRAHIKKFDARPFEEKCTRCRELATQASLYIGNARVPYYWCDDCDPYSQGAVGGKLIIVKKYQQALRFVDFYCNGSRTEKRLLIRALARAKGAPARIGKEQADSFLA